MEGFKLSPLEALFSFLRAANPTYANKLIPENFTIGTITNLGTANPNTKVVLQGTGAVVSGNITVAYNRLNIKKVFNAFGSVLKRPVVKIHRPDKTTTTVTVAQIIQEINETLGINFDTISVYKDFAGSTSITLPAIGSYIDVDIPVDGSASTSLRLVPDAANPLQVRILVAGYTIVAVITDRMIRPILGATPLMTLRQNGLININDGKKVAQFLAYNQDFTSVFDGINHTTETGHGVITGAAVTRFNAKMTELGIGISCSTSLKLKSGEYAHNIFKSTPDPLAGGNPRFTSNVLIDTTNLTLADGFSVAGTLPLGIKPVTKFSVGPLLQEMLADIDFTAELATYATAVAPAGYASALTLINTGGSDDTTVWWSLNSTLITAINAKLVAAGLPALPGQFRIANRYIPAAADAAVLWPLLCKTTASRTVPTRASWSTYSLQINYVSNPLDATVPTQPLCLYFNAG
jgi:hypothetical protein